MSFVHFAGAAGAAYRALTASKEGPSLYDVCDPLLLHHRGGDPHLAKFYRTALGNPALRAILRRAGLPELADRARLQSLRDAVRRARDDHAPDWETIGQPIADLLDTIALDHPKPEAAVRGGPAPSPAKIESAIRICGAHLLRSYARCGFIPTYAAFNLIGDADMRGRELLMALRGLNSRGYKNSTLLFNLARVFIARSNAAALINPPWRGIAEPMWEPMQIRHRSAYYDAFFTEALLSFIETGLASPDEAGAARTAISGMLDFYAGYQVREGDNEPRVTVPLNDHIDYEGGIVTWIDNLNGERPFGNDLDPTLNLDILEVSFRNLSRWKILETPPRLETLQRIIAFQKRLTETGAFTNPRSHVYYLPELYFPYFGP